MHKYLSMLQIQLCDIWVCRNIVQVAFFLPWSVMFAYSWKKKILCDEIEYKTHAR